MYELESIKAHLYPDLVRYTSSVHLDSTILNSVEVWDQTDSWSIHDCTKRRPELFEGEKATKHGILYTLHRVRRERKGERESKM